MLRMDKRRTVTLQIYDVISIDIIGIRIDWPPSYPNQNYRHNKALLNWTLVVHNSLRGPDPHPLGMFLKSIFFYVLKKLRAWNCNENICMIAVLQEIITEEMNPWNQFFSASIHLHPSCFGAKVHIFRRCPCCPHQVQWQLAWGQDALVSSNNVATGSTLAPATVTNSFQRKR